ncbi:MAG: gamma-glutamyl-gamma-aminobutyrate hydrolase family protein [Anaerolineae bacterium]|nr:gamma-glutamyl-gamma-aminobutyrate hydrolase family protein [Anaerolineae bacterium]
MKRPLIGLVGGLYEARDTAPVYGMLASYFKALSEAGAAPFLIAPNVDEEALRAIYERCDGILLAGGPDVHPSRYNMGEDHVHMQWVNPDRDAAEIKYTQWAVDEDKPVLAICRGYQVANVALGGTLYRDIATEYPGHNGIKHDQWGREKRTFLAHEVTLQQDSKLAKILGEIEVPVNSLHHQALRDIAKPFTVTAHATDGLPEAVEIPDKRFFVGVQWHPEELVNTNETAFTQPMRHLFSAFVESAANTAEG